MRLHHLSRDHVLVAIDIKKMQDSGNHGKQLQVGCNSNCNGKHSQVGNSNRNSLGKRPRTEDVGSQSASPARTPRKIVVESCAVGNASGKGKSKSNGNALGVGGNSNGNSNDNNNDNNDDDFDGDNRVERGKAIAPEA